LNDNHNASPTLSASEVSAELKKKLLTAFFNMGLLPSLEAYEGFRCQVAKRGKQANASFFKVAPRDNWNHIHRLRHRRDLFASIEWILGFGACLTEFVIDPVPIPDRFGNKLVELGALANIFAATFDLFLDSGICGPDVVAQQVVLSLSLSSVKGTAAHPTYGKFAEKIIGDLLTEYYRLLHGFDGGANGRFVQNLLAADIERLFAAEAKTLDRKSCDVEELKDKSALLLVIMGLPAWLAADRVELERIIEHRRWLYKVGDFMGWIDDIADLESDRRRDHPNRVAMWLKLGNPQRAPLDEIVRYLSGMAASIMEGWKSHCRGKFRHEFTLSAAVVSWLKGREDLELLYSRG
jgi:hypothetical protein